MLLSILADCCAQNSRPLVAFEAAVMQLGSKAMRYPVGLQVPEGLEFFQLWVIRLEYMLNIEFR